jgi:glycosyltransferase involved in cell wall biosynthesis
MIMKLKVAIIDNVGRKAGMDSYNDGLASGLLENGCDVTVMSNYPSTASRSVEIFKKYRHRLWSFFAFLYCGLDCRILRVRVCIVHLFDAGFSNYLILSFYKLLKLDILLIVHDIESLSLSENATVKRRTIALARTVVVHNQYCKNELLAKLGSENMDIRIIPHGCSVGGPLQQLDRATARDRLKILHDEKIVLFFGQIKKVKRLDLVIAAASLLGTRTRIIVAGKFKRGEYPDLDIEIKKISSISNITMIIRHISNEERDILFAASDLCVLPYERIYASGVLAMSVFYGVPVMCSDIPVFVEAVSDGVNGFLFKSGDSDDLARKIIDCLNQPRKLRKCAENARRDIAERNSWSIVGRIFSRAIAECHLDPARK